MFHIEHLSCAYPTARRAPVVRDVSVTAAPGRITAIIGPNAAGKTTLLRAMIGAMAPMAGRVMIDDQDVGGMSPRARAQRFAYVAQRPSVAAEFTAREVIALGRYALRPDDRAIDRAMSLMDVQSLAMRRYAALSTGQQQRIMLARALAQTDSTTGGMVLDEPTAAMDLNRAAQTMTVLRERADAGQTIVVALHDLTRAAAVADDVWLLQDGELVAAGAATDIMQPEVLQPVFGVAFARVEDGQGRSLLVMVDD